MAYQKAIPRTQYELGIMLKDTSQIIGNCGLQITSPANRTGLADCSLNRRHWYTGYAVEAVLALMEFGFTELKLHRIFATCAPDNLASQRVLTKLGMKKEGCLREDKQVHGQWRDSLVYAILEYEWKANMGRSLH
jgi:ribosomal-protein-alanine N-acetyltransferase